MPRTMDDPNIKRRNEDILARYTELYENDGLRVDRILVILEEEFYLNQNYIYTLIFRLKKAAKEQKAKELQEAEEGASKSDDTNE